MISETQEGIIIEKVSQSGLKNQQLKDDLIDHLCCLTEMNINKGMAFEKALERSMEQTAPNGLLEIEQETIFLLNHSKIIIMKKLTYVLGYVFALTWIGGVLFKILHFPWAHVPLAVGTIGMVCIFLPLIIINRYKSLAREVLSERMKWILGSISLLLLIISTWMRYSQIPGAYLLTALSALIFAFGFLPFFFFRLYKKSLEEV